MATLSKVLSVPRRRASVEVSKKYEYETVVVYDGMNDTPIARLVELPGHEIQAHLDHRSRYKSTSGKHYIVSVVLAVTVSVAAMFGLFFALGTPPFGALVLALFLGPSPGAVAGVIFAGKLKPKPIWTMRRYWRVEDDDTASLVVESIIHRQFTDEEFMWQTYKEADGKEKKQLIPQVHRATALYELTVARDETRDLKGRTNPRDKIEMGLAAVTALAAIGLLIFYAIGTQPPPGG